MKKQRHQSHTWSPIGANQVCVHCWCIEHEAEAFVKCVPVREKRDAKRDRKGER